MAKTKAPHPIDVTVGAHVRRLRIAHRISQETLADRLDLTFQQVQKYEKGTNRISASKLHQIAEAFGCSITELFAGTAAPSGVPLPQLSASAMRAAAAFDSIDSPRQRSTLLALITAMAATPHLADEAIAA